jgi:hypothetical protein
VFQQRFANYIAGFSSDTNADGVPDRVDAGGTIENSTENPGAGEFTVLRYQQAPAVFRGLEAEIAWQPQASPWSLRPAPPSRAWARRRPRRPCAWG